MAKTAGIEDDLITPKEAAGLLGYDLNYFYRLIRQGAVPYRQNARHGRIMISRRRLAETFPNRSGNDDA
ncbi:MAG: helix-turn-helix domain-containing protein [Phycisphaeraceae bacterium]